jgi:hypothetical protein
MAWLEVESPAPRRIVIEREDALDGFCAVGPGLEQGFERATNLTETGVGVFAVPRWRAVDPVQNGCDFQQLAARLQEIVVQHIDGIAQFRHVSRTSLFFS